MRAQLAELAATHGQRASTRHACRGAARVRRAPRPRARRRGARGRGARRRFRSGARSSSGAPRTPHEAREQVAWLTRLGILENERAQRGGRGVGAWKRAAALASTAGDDAIARDLYERVREVAPRDVDATQQLADLLERAEVWERLPGASYEVLVETAERLPPRPSRRLSRWPRVSTPRCSTTRRAAYLAAEHAFLLDSTRPRLLATLRAVRAARRRIRSLRDGHRRRAHPHGGAADPLRVELDAAPGRARSRREARLTRRRSSRTEDYSPEAHSTTPHARGVRRVPRAARLGGRERATRERLALAHESWRVAHAPKGSARRDARVGRRRGVAPRRPAAGARALPRVFRPRRRQRRSDGR